MLPGKLLGIPLFTIFWTFFIYSFLGWIYESTFVSIRKKTFVNRGFLNGPIIPIYGCGAMLVELGFFNSKMIPITETATLLHMIEVFIIGMILASILEYVTSYFMEKWFHAKWWDYSDYPLNIKGRISLRSSLFWGVLSVVGVYVMQPLVHRFIIHLKRPVCDYILYACIVAGSVDFYLTVRVTLHMTRKLAAVEKLKEVLYEYSSGIHWYDKAEEWKEKIERSKWYEHVVTIKNNKLHHMVYKRLFKAFPKLKVVDRQQVFEEFKKKLLSIRR